MNAAAYAGALVQASLEAAVFGLGLALVARLAAARLSASVRHALLLVGLSKFAAPPLLPPLWPAPAGLAPSSPLSSPAGSLAWLVGLQVVGGLAVALGLAWSAMRLRSASADTVDAGPELRARVEELARLVGTRLPRPQLASGRISPRVEGLVHPRLILPRTTDAALAPEERAAVIAHELAHLRRRDLQVHAVAAVLACFWWFHPVFWLLLRALRRAEEQACDDLAVASGATSTVHLSRALIVMSETLADLHRPALAAAAAGDLRERVSRLCDPTLPRRRALGPWRAAVLTLLALLSWPPLAAARRAPEDRSGLRPTAPGAGELAWGADHVARHRARHRH